MSAFAEGGLARLHEAMAARVARQELPGLVTLLARDDEVHVDTIGLGAFDGTMPMRRDTLFRIASLTKPIVATVTMMLVEDGVLDLHEPVDRLLPELADRRVLRRIDGPLDDTEPAHRPITLEDLLTFRMGSGLLTEPTFNPPFPIVRAGEDLNLVLGPPDPRTPHDPDQWMRLFGTLPLMSQPGQRWLYHHGTLVLGVLIARAAGAALGDVLRARLFEPLGMVDTGFVTSPENAKRIPTYHMSDATDAEPGPPAPQPTSPPEEWTVPPPFPSASSGLLSTVDDLLAFGRLLHNGGTHEGERLLSSRSVTSLATNHLTPEQIATAGVLLTPKGWGYGMGITPESADSRADHQAETGEFSVHPGRYGWDGGYGTTWFNDAHRGLIAIALSQTSDFLFNGARDEFTDLALRACD